MLATIRTLRTPTARMGLRAMSSDRLEPQQAESLMQIGTRTIFDSDHGTHLLSLPLSSLRRHPVSFGPFSPLYAMSFRGQAS